MKKPIQIAIPQLCHEKWDKMTPADKGRFCDACQKNLIDFTKASDREIANAINNNKNLCGRFSTSQLDRDLVVRKEKSNVWTAVAAVVFSFVTLGSYKASAQEKVKTEQTDSKTNSISQGVIPEKWLITGTISDDSGPLPNVNVIVKGTQNSTQTDYDGNYSIEVKKGDILQFSFLSFKPQNISIKNQRILDIKLQEADIVLGEITTIVHKRSFFGRMFHSIGNIFR